MINRAPYLLEFYNLDEQEDEFMSADVQTPPPIGAIVRVKHRLTNLHYEGIVVRLYYDYCIYYSPKTDVYLANLKQV